LERIGVAEALAALTYRDSVEAQRKADAIPIPKLSERAEAAVATLAAASGEKAQTALWRSVTADPALGPELKHFSDAVQRRFGAETVRAMLRSEGGLAEAPSVPREHRPAHNSTGILFVGSSGGSTVFGSGAATTTIFGGSGSDIDFQNTGVPGVVMAAEAGNETLSAALSSSNNTLAGGSGADSLVGGSGDDVLWASIGNDTLTGGAGSDTFNFVLGSAGGTDVIIDFTSTDTVNLIGYGSGAAATAIAGATISSGSITIQLADSTRITFFDVGSLASSNIRSS
jgi:hypothetical protein